MASINTSQAVEQTHQPKPSAVLSDKGYHAMSLTLDMILESVIMPSIQSVNHTNTTFTLFCPRDQAFFNSKYPQPPLTLLKYHVVPFKFDRDTIEAFVGHGSNIRTLLPGHPLVVTSLPTRTGGSYASINRVKITEWGVYNNGRLIVHGVEDFFDPAFQTLLYPQYDTVATKVQSRGFSWQREVIENWILLVALVAACTCVLILVNIFCDNPWDKEDVQYYPLYY
ncbi:uncharacterized protein Pyn_06609 [Prunus yedoensis var. nudiflora]|uniref:FAS1 domain-containing protein n=1 Tax=Prunus yedoensis var. nudiflora TaxID=2094558 RepID=A0A314Y6H2_PRUYE|nr:uncharacterized protein Pyn_06609 [Prunus yedoensis var. nudiflora]